MSKLDELKGMKIPKYNPELSSKIYEAVVLIAAGTRSRAQDVFNGKTKEEMDNDKKTKKEGANKGLGKDAVQELCDGHGWTWCVQCPTMDH